ncbi:MAG: hypothetical protein U1F56_16455 [Rubrivivax sp.]
MMPEVPPPVRIAAALPTHEAGALRARLLGRAAALPADHPDRQPTSGSVRLRALDDDLPGALWRRLVAGPLGPWMALRAPAPWGLLGGQCWLRCQHPPGLRPAGQHPHQWHQDGALGCCFDPAAPPEALAPLLTVWVALDGCGDDAPSLQWIDTSPDALLAPAELVDAALLRRFGAAARRHAVLDAGDALVFGGALLHRSHVTAAMSRSRASVELRVALAALPPRLADELLQVVDA